MNTNTTQTTTKQSQIEHAVEPGYANAYGTDTDNIPALDRRASRQRRRLDHAHAPVNDVIERAELIEMANYLRDYLACQRWDIDPGIRRQAEGALAWMTDRGAAPLIMRLGARAVLARGWPDVMEDLMARLEALDLEIAEQQMPGKSEPMAVGNHSQWQDASRHARMIRAMERRLGLSSFLEQPPDPVTSNGHYLPPEDMRERGFWSTGRTFFS